jgi:glycosyltransferase involved in cell wall biosynthesis
LNIALIAPPFIAVPPKNYGGTELFLARLAEALQKLGHKPVVYSNGEATVRVEKRWIYERGDWPIKGEIYDNLKDLNHTAWAVQDASSFADVIHLNNAPGLVCWRFSRAPFVYTVHHPHVPGLSNFYANFPNISFVTISNFQRAKERMPRMRTIHHGLDLGEYKFDPHAKREYLSFLGRIAPIKGTHLAIAVAKQAGIPLKIAGEVQPMYRDYFETQIRPEVDGKFIEYVGTVNLAGKNELLSQTRALVFPIQWDEPFGLVLIEAMACGAPALAFARGAVPEIVRPGVSGFIGETVEELAQRAQQPGPDPADVRRYVEENFSVETMAAQYAELYAELQPVVPAAGEDDLETRRRSVA